jgi:putative PIN family toxin of toxin-antitoxin system
MTIIRNGYDIVISKEMLEEFLRVANDPVIRRYVTVRDVLRFVKDIASVAKPLKIRSRVEAEKRDPSDDMALGTSYSGKARFIVTGDEDLLEMGRFRRPK